MTYPTAAAAERAVGSLVLFQFTYRSMPCRIVAGKTTVTLETDMGIMPFTGDGPSLRRNTLAVLDRARRLHGYGIRLMPDHRICLTVALSVERKAPAASILAEALIRLTEAKPFLDSVLSLLPAHLRHHRDPRISAYRMVGSGIANTCPG